MLNRKHTVILSDYGIDDAVALVFLLKKRAPGERIDILPVGGNVPRDVAHRNAAKLLAHYNGDLSGVRLVDTSEIAQPGKMLTEIHGIDGMGDLLPDAPAPVPTLSLHAHRAEWGKYTMLSLGPCTVTAALLADGRCEELILMGGTVDTPPNFGEYEFNEALDPQAFARTVRHPHVVATLDTCTEPRYNFRGKIRGGNDLLTRLQRRACEMEYRMHPRAAYIYDYIAARYLVFPGEFRKVTRKDPHGNILTCLV